MIICVMILLLLNIRRQNKLRIAAILETGIRKLKILYE